MTVQPAKGACVTDRPHIWTLPLTQGRWGYLQLPSRHVTEEEWEQLQALLEVFKPALIEPAECVS